VQTPVGEYVREAAKREASEEPADTVGERAPADSLRKTKARRHVTITL